VEKINGMPNGINSHNRSTASLELGYFVKPAVQVFAVGAGQLTHGGMPFKYTVAPNTGMLLPNPYGTGTVEELHNHDRISESNYLDIGGGAAFAVTGALDVFGSWTTTVTARNAHASNRSLTFGMAFAFSPERVIRKHRSPEEPPAQ